MLPYFWPKPFVLGFFCLFLFLIELQAAETVIDKVRLFPSKSFTDFLSASELNFGLHTGAWIS